MNLHATVYTNTGFFEVFVIAMTVVVWRKYLGSGSRKIQGEERQQQGVSPVSVYLNRHLILCLIWNQSYDDDVVVADNGVGVVFSASHAQYGVYPLS